MINRLITLPKNNSFFLFGTRGTGKTSLLNERFRSPHSLYYDLLDIDTYQLFLAHPAQFKSSILEGIKNDPNLEWVIVDEVQKAPALLDSVHQLIETKKLKFALTGSSARKLKRGGTNLLAGRALVNYLSPFTHIELQNSFFLQEALEWGGLPKVILEPDKNQRKLFLKSYTQTYLKEEIAQEQIVRKLDPF